MRRKCKLGANAPQRRHVRAAQLDARCTKFKYLTLQYLYVVSIFFFKDKSFIWILTNVNLKIFFNSSCYNIILFMFLQQFNNQKDQLSNQINCKDKL